MSDSIQETIRRTQRYWYIDGLAEIIVGMLFLLFGGFYLFSYYMPNPVVRGLLLGIGQPALIIGGVFLSRVVVRKLKEWITYPRTGMVVYRKPAQNQRRSKAIWAGGIAVVVSMSVILLQNVLGENWMPVISSLFAAVVILVIALRVNLVRLYLLAVYVVAAGVVNSLVNLEDPYSYVLFFAAFGFGWLVSGAVTLVRYLTSTSLMVTEEE